MKKFWIGSILIAMSLMWGCDREADEVGEAVDDEQEGSTDRETYFLVADQSNNEAHLIDYDGVELFNWDFNGSIGNDINLLSDGSLIVCLKANNAAVTEGGYGGIFRKINADQTIDWEVTYSSPSYTAHHDVEYLSNGNIIFLAWEIRSNDEAVEEGYAGRGLIYPETIVEMNPLTEEIVWKWDVMDHIVQDYDDTRANYGVVADNPNKVDLNYTYSSRDDGDLFHFNGLTVDEENDLIYVTVNFYSEVWVIDHSTTTEEASSDTGGTYGKGGDLVYRFGNPETYDNVGDVTLDRVHYPNMLESGNLLVYANEKYDSQSEVVEFALNPPYSLVAGQDNEPEVVWSFTDSRMYSSGLSGAERMDNGHTLITEGRDGTLWEVTEDGTIEWLFKTDYSTIWRTYVVYSDDPALEALGL